MVDVDPIMTYILIGLFTGIFSLLLVNIFIALLSSTFERVQHSAKAYFLLLRAQRLINNENKAIRNREAHLRRLRQPYEERSYQVQIKEDKEDYLGSLTKDLNKSRDDLKFLNMKFDDLKLKIEQSTEMVARPRTAAAAAANRPQTAIAAANETAMRRLYNNSNNISRANEIGSLKREIGELNKLIQDLLKE